MPLALDGQCCDANFYKEVGEMCAHRFAKCWHELRPVGSQLYYSLPFRFGLGAEWIIPVNALLILAVALLGWRACLALLPRPSGWLRWALAAAILGIHVSFMGGIVRNTLSDLPAGGAALLGIWLLCLASSKERPWMYGASGAFLGLSAMTRAFFLYPSILCVAVVLFVSATRKRGRFSGFWFLAAYTIPVLFQLLLTHHYSGDWSFIAKGAVESGAKTHFETMSYGYDTFASEWGLHYDAPECFLASSGMSDAFAKHAIHDVACLVGYRQWFYFGSYTPFGAVYLHSDRSFSVALLCANGTATVGAVVWLLRRSHRRPLLWAVLAFLGAIWAEGSAIIPEERFLLVVHVATWVFAAAAASEAAAGPVRRLTRLIT